MIAIVENGLRASGAAPHIVLSGSSQDRARQLREPERTMT